MLLMSNMILMKSRRPSLTIELVAIRAVLDVPESASPAAAERADQFTRQVLGAMCPGLAKTQLTVAPSRRVAS